MKGSKEPDAPTDEMCGTCGLYYSNRGINSHERNCDVDEPILPLDRHEDTLDPTGEGSPEGSDPSDGVGTGADPEPTPPEGESDTEPAAGTATDGGSAGLDLPGKPSLSGVNDPLNSSDESEKPDTVDCPTCGADTGLTPDEHENGRRYLNDCGHKYRWSA